MSWNGVFMAEVQKHECLYNKFCREYRNRELRNECWQKVATKFDMLPMDAEKKFRNIRTAYGRYLKKRRSAPAGSGSQEFVPFAFENCEWLAVHIIHRNFDAVTSFDLISAENNTKHHDSTSDDESSPVTMTNVEFMNYSGDYSDDTSPVNDDNTIESIKSAPVPVEVQTAPVMAVSSNSTISNKVKAHETPKRTYAYTKPQELDLSASSHSAALKDSYSQQTPQYFKRKFSEIEDEDDLYCRSLVPRLKRLTPKAKAYVRIQMEQLLFHAQYSDQTPQIVGGPQFTEKTQTSFLNGRPIEQARNTTRLSKDA